MLKDKVYDILKWIVITFLPALEILVAGLGLLYGFDATKISGTIALLAAFLGALIGVSTYKYNKLKTENDYFNNVNRIDN